MNIQRFETQALELYHFLRQYSSIWSQEVLNDFPHTFDYYPQDWIHLMASLNDQESWQWDCGLLPEKLKNSSLEKLHHDCKNLTFFEPVLNKDDLNLPSWAFHKVSLKKRHEISCLMNFLKDQKLMQEKSPLSIVDIGGGQGHLSRIIAHYFGRDVSCLEQNYDFIELGQKRARKFPLPNHAKDVDFIRLKFGQNDPLESEMFTSNTLSLGLHTCGPLALKHIERFIESNGKAMVNFGCCYHLLDPKDMIYLSQFSKDNLQSLDISSHALTLATRGHSFIRFEDYQLKKKVKSYRYALHLLFQRKLEVKNFIAVGSSKTQEYKNLSFSEYALTKIPEELKGLISAREIEDFYLLEQTQKDIEMMYFANLIRWKFGRALECYLLLNRAIYLFEKNKPCEIYSFFDETLSPRNLGLVCMNLP